MPTDLTKPASLTTSGGTPLDNLSFHFTWETSGGGKKGMIAGLKKAKGTDLDASLIALDSEKTPIGFASHDNPTPFRGALRHLGDDKRGRGGETIEVNLAALPTEVQYLVCVLSSYDGKTTFERVNNAVFTIYHGDTPTVLGETYLPVQGTDTAALMAKVWRDGNGWQVERLKVMGRGATWRDVAAMAAQHL